MQLGYARKDRRALMKHDHDIKKNTKKLNTITQYLVVENTPNILPFLGGDLNCVCSFFIVVSPVIVWSLVESVMERPACEDLSSALA